MANVYVCDVYVCECADAILLRCGEICIALGTLFRHYVDYEILETPRKFRLDSFELLWSLVNPNSGFTNCYLLGNFYVCYQVCRNSTLSITKSMLNHKFK